MVAPEHFAIVLAEAPQLARKLATNANKSSNVCHCLCVAPAQHTDEACLFNALYEFIALNQAGHSTSQLVQVDFKYIQGAQFEKRVEQPDILVERKSRLSQIVQQTEGAYPRPKLDWLEAQFWRWIYYGLAKWRRGEYLEVADHLSFLRNQVLGPLVLWRFGQASRRVRRIEQLLPAKWSQRLSATAVHPEPWPLLWALKTQAEIYDETYAHLQQAQEPPHTLSAILFYHSKLRERVWVEINAEFQPRSTLYHIARSQDWQRAQEYGVYSVKSLCSEGFIHLAYGKQIKGVYQRYYQNQPHLWLLHIAPERLRPELREENLYGGTELFPHLYGAIPLAAVSEQVLLTDSQGLLNWPKNCV